MVCLSSCISSKRRFKENIIEDIVTIDDYAHHPTEIKATIETAKKMGKNVCVVFQPHTYSRTLTLLDGFAECRNIANFVIRYDNYQPHTTSESLLPKRMGGDDDFCRCLRSAGRCLLVGMARISYLSALR